MPMSMSLADDPKRVARSSSAQLAYSHAHSDKNRTIPHPTPPPSLPSMFSLLSGPEHVNPAAQLHRPMFQSQPIEKQHPLHLSEMNPSAPVHHIYHAAQEHAFVSYHRAEPVLVPLQPAMKPLARLERVPISPLAPRRQSKKIGQRRDEVRKGDVGIGKTPAAVRSRSIEPEYFQTRRSQEFPPMPQVKDIQDSSEPRSHREVSPISAPPTALPSNLTSSGSSGLQRSKMVYNMIVRQQPIAARACGFGERDRRVIDPPPILQLFFNNPTSSSEDIHARLRMVHLVVHCTLWDPASDTDATTMPNTADKRQQRRLMGTLVSSPFIGKDEFNVEGCFFTFPDLSVRTPGTFSLKFVLAVIEMGGMAMGCRAPIRTVVKSAPFDVFNAKDFGGMRASTALTKELKHQGCLISVKKGNAKNYGRNEDGDEDGDDEEDEEDEEDNERRRPAAKRNKRN